MKIIVIGGTGLIGSKLVEILRAGGHGAIAASPRTGVDSLSGAGLAEALVGAEAVVDVANSPSFEDEAVLAFFETTTRNILSGAVTRRRSPPPRSLSGQSTTHQGRGDLS